MPEITSFIVTLNQPLLISIGLILIFIGIVLGSHYADIALFSVLFGSGLALVINSFVTQGSHEYSIFSLGMISVIGIVILFVFYRAIKLAEVHRTKNKERGNAGH